MSHNRIEIGTIGYYKGTDTPYYVLDIEEGSSYEYNNGYLAVCATSDGKPKKGCPVILLGFKYLKPEPHKKILDKQTVRLQGIIKDLGEKKQELERKIRVVEKGAIFADIAEVLLNIERYWFVELSENFKDACVLEGCYEWLNVRFNISKNSLEYRFFREDRVEIIPFLTSGEAYNRLAEHLVQLGNEIKKKDPDGLIWIIEKVEEIGGKLEDGILKEWQTVITDSWEKESKRRQRTKTQVLKTINSLSMSEES